MLWRKLTRLGEPRLTVRSRKRFYGFALGCAYFGIASGVLWLPSHLEFPVNASPSTMTMGHFTGWASIGSTSSGSTPSDAVVQVHAWGTVLTVLESVMLAFFFVLLWKLLIEATQLRGRCDACGYSAQGSTTGRCPECGSALGSESARALGPPLTVRLAPWIALYWALAAQWYVVEAVYDLLWNLEWLRTPAVQPGYPYDRLWVVTVQMYLTMFGYALVAIWLAQRKRERAGGAIKPLIAK